MPPPLHLRPRWWPLALLAAGLATGAAAGPVGDLLADNPARIAPTGVRLQAQAGVDAFSDPAALLRLDDDDWGRHARSRHATNQAQLDAQAAVGVQAGGWQLQLLTRSGGIAHASADAVRLLALLNRGEAPGSGERFELDYRLDHWRASGLALGRGWHWDMAAGQRVELGAAVQVLTRVELLQETFRGTATPAGTDRMLFDGLHLRAGSLMRTDDPSRFNPYVRDGHPGGHGQAVQLGLRWTLSPQWQVELAGMDLAARLDGHDMPESLRVGRFLYDGHGRLIGNADGSAAVQGEDRRTDLRLRPAARWVGRLGWQRADWQVDLLAQTQAGVPLLELATRHALGEGGFWVGASLTARNPALGLSAGNDWFSLSLASSHLRPGEARALGATARVSLPL